MTLYDSFIAAGCRVCFHESDLYVQASPEARAIIKAATDAKELSYRPVLFRSEDPEDNGAFFYEFPFAYTPFWRNKGFKE